MNDTHGGGNHHQGGFRGDPGAPRTPTDGTRDPHSSAASSADHPLPSEIDGDWMRGMTLEQVAEHTRSLLRSTIKAFAAGEKHARAAADPALRTLSQQWRKQVVPEAPALPVSEMTTTTLTDARRNWWRAGYAKANQDRAADLDRLCPEIREEQQEPPPQESARGRTRC